MKETIAERYSSEILQPIDELYFSNEDLAKIYSNVCKYKTIGGEKNGNVGTNTVGRLETPTEEAVIDKVALEEPNKTSDRK